MKSNLYWVYVIQSLEPRHGKRGPLPGFFYVGMTTDPMRRVHEHNGLYQSGKTGNKKGGKYTSKHRPWLIRAIHGPFATRSDAMKAEYALKHSKRGTARLKWASSDSHWCRGLGTEDPRIEEINERILPLIDKMP